MDFLPLFFLSFFMLFISMTFTDLCVYMCVRITLEDMRPYFNDLKAWSKAQSAGALRACPNPLLLVFTIGKTAVALAHGLKGLSLFS